MLYNSPVSFSIRSVGPFLDFAGGFSVEYLREQKFVRPSSAAALELRLDRSRGGAPMNYDDDRPRWRANSSKSMTYMPVVQRCLRVRKGR